MSNFGNFIKNYREEYGLTMSAFARKAHIAPSTVAKWEYGTRFPEVRETIKLSRRINVNVMKLIELIVKDLEERV